jgi:hypothetical protein
MTRTGGRELELALTRRARRAPQLGSATCACGHALTPPWAWAGRRARCPACGVEAALPAWLPARAGQASDREGYEAVPDLDERARVEAAARRQRRRRRMIAGGALGFVLLLFIGSGVAWRLYIRSGRWVQTGPKVDPVVSRADLMARQAAGLFEHAPIEIYEGLYILTHEWSYAVRSRRPDPRLQLPVVANNLAWRLLTSERERLRDPEWALELAREAVLRTEGRAAFILDTYAEALFQGGQAQRAVEQELRALKLEPEHPFYEKQLERFRAGRP